MGHMLKKQSEVLLEPSIFEHSFQKSLHILLTPGSKTIFRIRENPSLLFIHLWGSIPEASIKKSFTSVHELSHQLDKKSNSIQLDVVTWRSLAICL